MDILDLTLPCKVIVARLPALQQIPLRADLAWLYPPELFANHAGYWYQVSTTPKLFTTQIRYVTANNMLFELIIDTSGIEILVNVYVPFREIFNIRTIRIVYTRGEISLSPLDIVCSESDLEHIHTVLMNLIALTEENYEQY